MVYPRCPACGHWHGDPRPWCVRCLHTPLELVAVARTGVVYAVTIVHRAFHPAFADLLPYAHVVLDLDEGVRVVSLVIDCAPEDVRPGMRVEAFIDLPNSDDEPATPLVLYRPSRRVLRGPST